MLAILEQFGCLLQSDVADEAVRRLIGQFLHLAVQVYTTDAHLLCYHVHTQVGIVDVFVDNLHYPLHQGIVRCLHFYLFYLVILAFIARKLIAQSAAHGEQVDDVAVQNVHVERLQNVGIGTGLQSFQLVFLTALGCEQDDRHIVGVDV